MSRIYKQVMELGSIVTGKTPSTENSELWGGNIPFITPTDIKGFDCYYQQNTERTISKEGARKQKKTLLPENSICVTCIGSTIGKLCLTKVPSISNQQINTIIPNADFDYRYLYYLIRLNIPYFQLIGGGCGAGTPILNKGKFERCKLLVEDSLPTQRKIASILSAYDSLIECNSKRIRLLEQMAENLYKEWFVRFRFPGHQNTKMINGLPEGWKIDRLESFGRIETGKTPSMEKPEYYGGMIPFIKTPDMKESMFVMNTTEALSEKGSNSQKIKLLPPYSIMVSCIGTGGVVAINTKPSHTNQQINSIILKDLMMLEFLFYTCKALKSTIELFGATGATMTNLSKGKFERLKVIMADRDTIERFHDKICPLFNEIQSLQRQNALLTRQRDLLLPRLMSGKLEVKPE